MTEEIINSDSSRNWQANILLDNIKRLEQDSKQLTQWLDEARRNADFWCDKCTSLEQENKELKELNKKICEDRKKEIKVYWNALEEINITVKQLLQGVSSNCINNTPYLTALSLIENKINEALQ